MSYKIDSQKLFLTPSGATYKRNDYFNSNLEFSIPTLFQGPNVAYMTIKCLHAEIPYSFYIVNEYNNLLSISCNGTRSDIYVPYGNYNANSFMKYLQTVLPSGVSISFNTTNGKFSLLFNGNMTVNSNSTCYILMGFKKGVDINSINNKIDFEYLANFIGSKNIYLKIPNLILDNYNVTTLDRATLSNIPVNVSPFSLIMYQNSSGSSTIIKSIQVPDQLIIQLTDDQNNLIDFNNTEFSITLQIDFYLTQ